MSLKLKRLKNAIAEKWIQIRSWISDRKKNILFVFERLFFLLKKLSGTGRDGYRNVNRILSSSRYLMPEMVIYITAAFLFSLYAAAMSTIHFHLLSVSGNSQIGIEIALIIIFSITIGQVLNFILRKIKILVIIIISGLLLVFSILLSYFSIINFEGIPFQYLLIIPYTVVSLALFTVIGRTKSRLLFFTAISSGSAGAVIPLFLISSIKAENLLFILAFFPMIVLFLNCFRIKNIPAKIISLSVCAAVIIRIFLLILLNTSGPPEISAEIFETKIMSELDKNGERRNFYKNVPQDFVSRSYYMNSEKDSIILNDLDEYDLERLNYILEVVGVKNRWGIGKIPFIRQQPLISDINVIDGELYDFEILPLIQDRYSLKFSRNYDYLFLKRVYEKKSDGNYYFNGNIYDAERVKYLLAQLCHLRIYDLYFDLRYNNREVAEKIKRSNADRLLYSRDSIYGRLEFTGQFPGDIHDIDENLDIFNLNINNIPINSIQPNEKGSERDPRVPWKTGEPEILIIGPSVDNIIKSAKILPGAKVDVADLHPEIEKLISTDNPFSYFARYPYEDVGIIDGISRSYLKSINDKYDEILIMNIQNEKEPFSLDNPLYYHSKEGLLLLLKAINGQGYIVFKEIVDSPRDQAAFLKLINTIKAAMQEYGVSEIKKCFYIYKWGTTNQDDIYRTIIIKKNAFSREENGAEMNLLEDYFNTISESPYMQKVQKLYDPYTEVFTDDYLGRVLEDNILKEIIIPEKLTSYDFSVRLISKMNNAFEINYLLNRYQYNPAQDSYLLLNNLEKQDIYQLKSIFEKSGFLPSFDLTPVTNDNPYPYNVYTDEFEFNDLSGFLTVLALVLFIPLILITAGKFELYKRKLVPYGLFAAVTSAWNTSLFFFLYFLFQKYFCINDVSFVLLVSAIFLLGGAGGFLADIMKRNAFFASVIILPVYLLFLMYKLDGIFQSLTDNSIELNFFLAYLILIPVILLTAVIMRYTYKRMAKNSDQRFMMIVSTFRTAVSLLLAAAFFRLLLAAGFNAVFVILTVFSALMYLGFIVCRKNLE